MNSVSKDHTVRKPFIEHVHELQVRLTWSVLAVFACGVGAYLVNDRLLAIIQLPLNQTLYYTSPTGGFSFIFKMSAVAGVVLALPIILYQLFKFLGPLLARVHKLTMVAYTMWSINLAYAGILFAYFFSLPAALHFLAKFGGDSIQSLITADEYFNFALAYLAGFAVLFQLPLIVMFINKIKPLKPRHMMGAQRYIILISFVVAAILTPTPDPINQAIMAVPVVLLYQLSIIMVLIINRKKRAERKLPQPVDLAERVQIVRAVKPEPVTQPIIQPVAAGYGHASFGAEVRSTAVGLTRPRPAANLVMR